ncbi:MAG: phosphoglycerate mutase family protein [Gammaproteobacteria bacterium]
MRPPGILRRRAPFLAPIWVAGVVALAGLVGIYLVGKATIAVAARTTTVIVLRHAEKSTEPLGDPALSPAGVARAARLAELLGAAPIAAIYASDTRRARATAAPLASRHRLIVTVRDGQDVAGLMDDIGARHVGRTVVVVGHSNTVPEIVAALTRGRRKVQVGEGDFGQVFVVTVTRFGPPAVTELRY